MYTKLPKLILHNSVSLDGSLTGFQPKMSLHYQIASTFKSDAHLIGSNTIKTGIELYGDSTSKEKKADFKPPKRDTTLPYWIIIDTKGILKNLLHHCRRFEFSRDIILILSDKTPRSYITYLQNRSYIYHIIKDYQNHIDLTEMLKLLLSNYNVSTILVDSGNILGGVLMKQGLIQEISLLVHPIIVGENAYTVFGKYTEHNTLSLQKSKVLEKQYLWLLYTVELQ